MPIHQHGRAVFQLDPPANQLPDKPSIPVSIFFGRGVNAGDDSAGSCGCGSEQHDSGLPGNCEWQFAASLGAFGLPAQ
jgi:hypothetical protein